MVDLTSIEFIFDTENIGRLQKNIQLLWEIKIIDKSTKQASLFGDTQIGAYREMQRNGLVYFMY